MSGFGRFRAAEIYHNITVVIHYDFKYSNQIDLSLLWMIHGNGLYKQTFCHGVVISAQLKLLLINKTFKISTWRGVLQTVMIT